MQVKNILIIISSLFIIIGLTIKTSNNYHSYLISQKENKAITNFINNQASEYIAIIEIPYIKLKIGIREDDNVDQGIMLLDKDKVSNDTFILASHSGNCEVGYFNHLDELKNKDIIYFYYNNMKYTFEIIEIERKRKLTFTLQDKVNTITLITCEKDNDNYQIIIIGNLISKEKY